MKKVTYNYYECEFCGNKYTFKEDAEECEKSHVKPTKIVESGFRYYASDNKHGGFIDNENVDCHGWPKEIEVEDELGNKGFYVYQFDKRAKDEKRSILEKIK